MRTISRSLSAALAAFAAIALLLFLFYPGLFTVREAFLTGDHYQQHYPWSLLLTESLKAGRLPYWTQSIQSGFPIAAEGQIAIYYPPNLLLGWLLPANAAYSYSAVFHFLLGGFFLFLYARKAGLTGPAAFVSAVVFLFGFSFGGAYYNITSLKTLAWLPVALYCLEGFLQSARLRYTASLTLALAMALLAGYLQIAVFFFLMFGVYGMLRILAFHPNPGTSPGTRVRQSAAAAASGITALLLASPQIWHTYELAIVSNRASIAKGFAFVGSMSPLAVITLLLPGLRTLFRANCLYVGLLSLFFILTAIASRSTRRQPLFKLWMWFALLSLLLALGKWSPLYVGIIELTDFHAFRIPSKFHFFTVLALAMLTGIGSSAVAEGQVSRETYRRAFRAFAAVLIVLWSGYVVFYICLAFFPNLLMDAGTWIISNHIFSKPGHPHSLEDYLLRLQLFLDELKLRFSPFEPRIYVPLLLSVFSMAALKFFRESCLGSGRRRGLAALITLLVVDLYASGEWGIRRFEIIPFEQPTPRGATMEALLKERNEGRLELVHSIAGTSASLPLYPNANMVFGYDDTGLYSPLAMSRYHETIGRIGYVNDSNEIYFPTPEEITGRLPLIRMLGVSHLLSEQELPDNRLQLLVEDNGASFLYRLTGHTETKAFFVRTVVVNETWPQIRAALLLPGFEPKKTLLLEAAEVRKLPANWRQLLAGESAGDARIRAGENSSSESQNWLLQTPAPGFFVVPETFFPGWTATVDGRPHAVLSAYGLFRAIWVPEAGEHQIRFQYDPWASLRDVFGHDKP